MAQFIRPTSDATNGWASGGFGDIDETPFSDSDFAYSNDKPATEVLEVHLGDPTDPAVSTGHIVRYRWATVDGGVLSGSGTAVTQDYVLFQSTTAVTGLTANQHTTNSATFSAASFTLSGAEADAITDYTDLRIRCTATGGGGSPTDRRGAAWSFAEMEMPDAPSTDRMARISGFEFEVASADRQAQVSGFEFEVASADRQAQISGFELEIPIFDRQARISGFELETPIFDRQARISGFELETDDAPRAARISAFELETPVSDRQARISGFELELPAAAGGSPDQNQVAQQVSSDVARDCTRVLPHY